ncbi:hypothetical protein XENOCAPTIV_029516 [Xenoophorus captivus]|uniref:Uncharacterized protein n=1 Tax=Xenoophorus captivus TaxID=1517983 RepID=A0ABV0R706_9TELE
MQIRTYTNCPHPPVSQHKALSVCEYYSMCGKRKRPNNRKKRGRKDTAGGAKKIKTLMFLSSYATKTHANSVQFNCAELHASHKADDNKTKQPKHQQQHTRQVSIRLLSNICKPLFRAVSPTALSHTHTQCEAASVPNIMCDRLSSQESLSQLLLNGS